MGGRAHRHGRAVLPRVSFPGPGEVADQADELRRRLAQLADMDARAYAAVLDAGRQPRRRTGSARERERGRHCWARPTCRWRSPGSARGWRGLAVRVAEAGNPNLRGDGRDRGGARGGFGPQARACLVDIKRRPWAGWIPGLSRAGRAGRRRRLRSG